MTTEQRREYVRERNAIKREQLRREKIKKQKRRMKLFFVLELLCIFAMLVYLLGRCTAHKSMAETDIMLSISEQDVTIKELSRGQAKSGKAETEEKVAVLPKDILLVNKEHKLPENYQVELVTLEDGVHESAKEAYAPLCEMLKAGRREGLVFEICSAYRSVERQQELFDEDMEAFLKAGYSYSQAYEKVAEETMPPGYSEHSTGLAFDIVAYDYQMLDDGQAETAENKWLQKHCAEYGFILRYPEGKEEITQISYESWHFRYVGVEAATYIMENQLTLEEYLKL